MNKVHSDFLNELYDEIRARKLANPEISYTASMFAKGRHKIAQKVGEEGVEVVIEAIANNKKDAIYESADLIFHLLMLWVDMGITPAQVASELERRKNGSGFSGSKPRED